jgi:hypothetical protein
MNGFFAQLFDKFTAFNRTRQFTPAFTGARHWTLYKEPVESAPHHHTTFL